MNKIMKLYIVKLSNLINRNTGFLIVLVLLIFGFAIVAFQRNNQLILKDTHAIAENTKWLLEQQKKEDETRDKAVQEVITANIRSDEHQTMILCTLILRGNVVVTNEEAVEIEQICEEEIQRFRDRGGEVEMSTRPVSPQPSPQSNPQPTEPPAQSPPPPSNESPPDPEPPEDPSVVGGLLEDVQETITNLTCNLVKIFCKE